MPSLFNQEYREQIAKYIDAESERLEVNEEIFSILENRLSDLLKAKMLKDLGPKSARAAIDRMSPINYYRKVIDKLSTIYQQGVVRRVVDGTEADQELVDWYVKKLNLDYPRDEDALSSSGRRANSYPPREPRTERGFFCGGVRLATCGCW